MLQKKWLLRWTLVGLLTLWCLTSSVTVASTLICVYILSVDNDTYLIGLLWRANEVLHWTSFLSLTLSTKYIYYLLTSWISKWDVLPMTLYVTGQWIFFLTHFHGSNNKECACNAGDLGLIPGSGRSSGRGNGTPHQYSLLENSMDRGAWQTIGHGVAKSWTRLSH